MVGAMAGIAAAYGKIDWASADVRAGILTLPLTGRMSPAWTGRLRDLVAAAEPDADGWATVEITRERLRVGGMRPGAGTSLHELLEHLVDQANADFAPPVPPPPPERVEHGTRRAVAASVALILLAVGAVALQWASWEVPVRAIVVVGFVAIGPGWALLRLWGLAGGFEGMALALAVSLSLAMVIAGATVYAGEWSPLGALVALASVTVLAALASLARAGRDRRALALRWSVVDDPRG
jgi:hypothetical protein